ALSQSVEALERSHARFDVAVVLWRGGAVRRTAHIAARRQPLAQHRDRRIRLTSFELLNRHLWPSAVFLLLTKVTQCPLQRDVLGMLRADRLEPGVEVAIRRASQRAGEVRRLAARLPAAI